MNVHRGGSLHQFLPDVPRENRIEHRRLERELPTHPVSIAADSQIGRAVGKASIEVNTYHKQAANTVGRGLRVVATAPDGVIEAFEDPTLPLFAAVQWHPERLNHQPEHLALFKLLVDKAREDHRRRR
jgi:putative glutamine amidotransferase